MKYKYKLRNMSVTKTIFKSLAIVATSLLTLTSCEADSESISDDSLSTDNESELSYSKSYKLWVKAHWGNNIHNNHGPAKSLDGKNSTWTAIKNKGNMYLKFNNRKLVDGMKFRYRSSSASYQFRIRAYDPNTKKWSVWRNPRSLKGGTLHTLELPNWSADRVQIQYLSSSGSGGYLNFEEVQIHGFTL